MILSTAAVRNKVALPYFQNPSSKEADSLPLPLVSCPAMTTRRPLLRR